MADFRFEFTAHECVMGFSKFQDKTIGITGDFEQLKKAVEDGESRYIISAHLSRLCGKAASECCWYDGIQSGQFEEVMLKVYDDPKWDKDETAREMYDMIKMCVERVREQTKGETEYHAGNKALRHAYYMVAIHCVELIIKMDDGTDVFELTKPLFGEEEKEEKKGFWERVKERVNGLWR